MADTPTTKCVALVSGGLDSTTLVYDLLSQGRTVQGVFFNYGQACKSTEWERLQDVLPMDIAKNVHTVDLTDVFGLSRSVLIRSADLWNDDVHADDLYLPYRNSVFLLTAAAIAQAFGAHEVCAGFINSNHAKEIDCSTSFFEDLGSHLSRYGAVSIVLPYREMSKSDVAKRAVELGVDIDRTFSCQVSPSIPCGVCPNCVDRLNALGELTEE